jgi:probable rRNA maturation factor
MHPDCELSIALVSEPDIERLHMDYMDEPGPTDVLSFPMDDLVPGGDDLSGPGVLGDIIICPAVARQQALTVGHSTEAELAVLLTHGVLHLLGHDHVEPDESDAMFDRQVALLEAWQATGGPVIVAPRGSYDVR